RLLPRPIKPRRQQALGLQRRDTMRIVRPGIGAIKVEQQSVERLIVARHRPGFQLMPEFHLRIGIVPADGLGQWILHARRLAAGEERDRENKVWSKSHRSAPSS